MGPIGCPETSVRNCHYSVRNNPQERSSRKVLLFHSYCRVSGHGTLCSGTVSYFEVFHSAHFHILAISSTAPTKFSQFNQPRHRNITKIRHGVFLRNLHPTDPSIIGSTLNNYCHNPVQRMTATGSTTGSTLNSYCHNPVQRMTATADHNPTHAQTL
jgi:hypothetical protein